MQVRNRVAPPKAGDSVTIRKTMTVADQAMFTGISGNLGPLYVDRNHAKLAGWRTWPPSNSPWHLS